MTPVAAMVTMSSVENAVPVTLNQLEGSWKFEASRELLAWPFCGQQLSSYGRRDAKGADVFG